MGNPWEATELFGKMLGEYTDNGYRMGTLDERGRIISLLESELNKCDCEEPLQHLTALINKDNA